MHNYKNQTKTKTRTKVRRYLMRNSFFFMKMKFLAQHDMNVDNGTHTSYAIRAYFYECVPTLSLTQLVMLGNGQ